MTSNRYKIVFDKLEEVVNEESSNTEVSSNNITPAELDEIEELRRIVFEMSESRPSFYTTT
ncbi:MAG: hypothetical protein BMS9Abin33_0558 [Gammaproteobacteria bacterium]|nr:MAG: hypothetical protein BMS9Abin33_0558 [Gammaproteobacteria bacterium]